MLQSRSIYDILLTKDRTQTPYVLTVQLDLSVEKRQDAADGTESHQSGFLDGQGTVTPSCDPGQHVYIKDGMLYDGNGTFSTNREDDTILFSSTAYVNGEIDTTFSVEDGVLVWRDPSFDNGVARFCIGSENKLAAVFRGDLPDHCSPASITLNSRTWKKMSVPIIAILLTTNS